MTRDKDAKEILKIVEKWKDGYPTTMYNKIHEYYYNKSRKQSNRSVKK